MKTTFTFNIKNINVCDVNIDGCDIATTFECSAEELPKLYGGLKDIIKEVKQTIIDIQSAISERDDEKLRKELHEARDKNRKLRDENLELHHKVNELEREKNKVNVNINEDSDEWC